MAGSTVNFFSPQALIAPDLAVEQQQIERQRALADALRAQSLENDVPRQGAVSWTQGVAKLAQALSANKLQKRADQRQMAINQAYASQVGNLFGGVPAKGGDPASGGGDASNGPSPSFNAAFTPQAMQAVQNGQPAPPVQEPAPEPQTYQPGPLSLSGNPGQDMALYAQDPQEYVKQVIATHAAAQMPTDFTKLLVQSGIDPNSPLGRTLMQSQIAKQNYVAPVNGRPGSTIRDPFNPSQILGYDAPTINGTFPTYGANGMPTGYQLAPGAAEAAATMEAATSGAKAAAQAPYDLITVVDPATGAQYQVPKSSITGGAVPAGGGLNGYYGRGASAGGGAPLTNQSGLGPGASEAAKTSGGASATAFNDAIQRGTNAPNALRTLDTILQAASGLQTGTGAGAISAIKSGVNAATGMHVFDPRDIAKFDEIKKNAASLAGQLSSGPTGTDARLNNAIEQLPNANYSPEAIKNVGYMLKGKIMGDQAGAQAAAKWMQQNGPNSYPQFQTAFQQAYEPEMFEAMARDRDRPGTFKSWMRQISPQRRADIVSRLQRLRDLGVSL